MGHGLARVCNPIAQLDLVKENLLLNQKRVQNAIANETAYKSDEDEIKVELINIQQKKDELHFNRIAYVNVLSLMVGEEISDEAVFTRPEFKAKLAELSVNRPEMMKFQNQKSLIDAQAKLNQATLFPKIGLMWFR